eukprot:gb/GEZJ01003711.1/.p1 GENE.gb/GEZJ01003711.1/~~gb/GEZJ01003711.1/.p1  ORF type:complete len:519 (+),score=74.88 gb/GEZJ01003711.1/:901-2457(+)
MTRLAYSFMGTHENQASSRSVWNHALEEQYGLRNIREEWIHRQRALSPEIVKGPISRTNLCDISRGTLPWNILQAHSVQLGVKVLVQVEDVINIANANPRSHDVPRVLQLTLNDGAIDFVAVELEPLGGRISMKTTPGTKIVLLPSTLVRRGRAFLTSSDFIFFGSPPTNLWGEPHQQRIAQSLRDAGLPNPSDSSFDCIARPQVSNGIQARIPIDMGGIADAITATENEDDDDVMFWAQAVEVADRNLGNAGTSTSAASAQDRTLADENLNTHEGMVTENNESLLIDLESTTRTNAIHEIPRGQAVDISGESRRQRNDIEAKNHSEPETDPPRMGEAARKVLSFPSTPVFESDDRAFEPQYEHEENAEEVDESSQDAIMTILDPPPLPFSKLGATEEGQRPPESLYRVYSMKIAKNVTIQHDGANYSFFVQVDDGTAIELLPINANVLRTITGFTVDSYEFQQDLEDGFPRIRKAIRGIHGFVRVSETPNGKQLIGISEGMPDNVVTIFGLPFNLCQ